MRFIVGESQNLKEFLQFDHQLPVGLLQVVAEIFFAGIDRFSADLLFHEQEGMRRIQQWMNKINLQSYLGNHEVFVIEMAAVEFRSVAGSRTDFDTNFLALASRLDRFVIDFNVGHDPDVHKL